MESIPILAKIDDVDIILTISQDTISAKTKEDRSIFEISIIDLVFCNAQTNNVILSWNTGNTISSAVISSRHARDIAKQIKQKI
jgi:hypothetical protein